MEFKQLLTNLDLLSTGMVFFALGTTNLKEWLPWRVAFPPFFLPSHLPK